MRAGDATDSHARRVHHRMRTADAHAPDAHSSDSRAPDTHAVDLHAPDMPAPDMHAPYRHAVAVHVSDLPAADVHPSGVPASEIDAVDECLVPDACIDRYLWSLYERTPKIDTVTTYEKKKILVKKKGKTRVVTKTFATSAEENFTWKDLVAAERVGMTPMDYVIGGMDRGFKVVLYHALHAADEAGFVPGITSAFRDDYRQSIASGLKAQSDSSYHGGGKRGGYGHGMAADIVSVRGATRSERWISSGQFWTWIDAHEKELGIGRPYLDRDAPHVGPITGKEYADKRHVAPIAQQSTTQPQQSTAQQTEAQKAGTQQAGTQQAGTQQAGTQQAGPQQSGTRLVAPQDTKSHTHLAGQASAHKTESSGKAAAKSGREITERHQANRAETARHATTPREREPRKHHAIRNDTT
jgi:hypothetical protein